MPPAPCPSAARRAVVIARFKVNLVVLQGWAVPTEASTLDHLGDYAIPGALATTLGMDWRAIRRWWTACLTAAERQQVNQAVQAFENPGGLFGSEGGANIGVGAVSGFGKDIAGVALRIAVGALGAVLIVVGVAMIGADVTLNQAATRLGRAIGGRTLGKTIAGRKVSA